LANTTLQDETRNKLIEAAGEVFADAGYQNATVREICARAGANVASVNYHFGDKLGLYTELLKTAAGAGEVPAIEHTLDAPTPEEALRRFLHAMFRQMSRADRPSWYMKVMAHEIAQPTEALPAVVKHVIKPKAQVLCSIVGRLIDRPPLDPKTRRCAHSIMGQVMHYLHARPVITLLWPDFKSTPIEEVADHITEFSLEALKGIRLKSGSAARKRRLK
jgi:TetR/AcrR family transcriptional regulator, regulator of cefoperazone and chloramphenicol sensitivity